MQTNPINQCFNVLVTGAPLGSSAMASALRFCWASEQRGQAVSQVFFFASASAVANDWVLPLDDEPHWAELWRGYAEHSGADLMICIASGERHGVIDVDQVEHTGFDHSNVAQGFKVVGLGVLHDAMLGADCMLHFK